MDRGSVNVAADAIGYFYTRTRLRSPAPTMMDVTEKYKGKGFTITGVRPPRPTAHVYEIRPRKDHRGFDLISDGLPFGRLWYTEIPPAIAYAKFRSRSHDAWIRVSD